MNTARQNLGETLDSIQWDKKERAFKGKKNYILNSRNVSFSDHEDRTNIN